MKLERVKQRGMGSFANPVHAPHPHRIFGPEQGPILPDPGGLQLLFKKPKQEIEMKEHEFSTEIPASPAPTSSDRPGEKAQSFIGGGLTIEGSIVSPGDLQIEGKVKGSVRCRSLVVGEDGQIAGEVVAEEVVVNGRIVGPIRGKFVMLKPDSHVEGDVYYQSLVVQMGAVFKGRMQHMDDPHSSATMSTVASKETVASVDTPKITIPPYQPTLRPSLPTDGR